MEFRIDFGGDPQDVTLTLSGEPDVATVSRCNRAFVSDDRFRPGLAILVDCTQLATDPDENALELLAPPVVERDWSHPPLAVAFVTSSKQTSEQLALWRAHLGGSSSRRQIFTSHEAAVDWLEQQRVRAQDQSAPSKR